MPVSTASRSRLRTSAVSRAGTAAAPIVASAAATVAATKVSPDGQWRVELTDERRHQVFELWAVPAVGGVRRQIGRARRRAEEARVTPERKRQRQEARGGALVRPGADGGEEQEQHGKERSDGHGTPRERSGAQTSTALH